MYPLNETYSYRVVEAFSNLDLMLPIFISVMVCILATWLVFHKKFFFKFLKSDHVICELFNIGASVAFASVVSMGIFYGLFRVLMIIESIFYDIIEATVELTDIIINLIESVPWLIILIVFYILIKKKKKEVNSQSF